MFSPGAPCIVPLSFFDAPKESRNQLESFQCAEPPQAPWNRIQKRRVHPAPWQMDVQSWIRALRPTFREPEYLVLGYDSRGIATVCKYEYTVASDSYFINILARANRVRGTGAADEALQEVLRRIGASRESGSAGYSVAGKVHPKNLASQQLLVRNGFRHAGDYGGLGLWIRNEESAV